MSDRVILIGCVKDKGTEPAPARDLYTSQLFRSRLAYAESTGLPWAVLSSLHGVVEPDRVLRPYDWTIARRKTAGGGGYAWAVHVIQACYFLRSGTSMVDHHQNGTPVDFESQLTVEIHAGVDYVDLIREHGLRHWRRDHDIRIEHPVAGMGIGEQKHYYSTTQPREPESIWRVIARQRHERCAT